MRAIKAGGKVALKLPTKGPRSATVSAWAKLPTLAKVMPSADQYPVHVLPDRCTRNHKLVVPGGNEIPEVKTPVSRCDRIVLALTISDLPVDPNWKRK